MAGIHAERANALCRDGVRETTMPTAILRYGVAILTVVVAFLMTWLFRAVLEPTVFLLFLPAVLVSAWYGGLKPGLVATFLSTWIIGFFLLQPRFEFTLSWTDSLRLLVFVSVATLISALSESRKRSNESLREANQSLRTLIEASPLAIVGLDLDTKVRLWSSAAERLLGWTEHEALNQPLPILQPDAKDGLRANLETARCGSVVTGWEMRCQRKDGAAINISVSAGPSRNYRGEINSIACVIGDITARKLSEDVLRESESKFRSVVQSASDGIILADGDGNIIQWNRRAQEIFGYAEKEVLGKPLTMLMPESYREAHHHDVERIRGGAEPHIIGRTVEMHGLRKDGTVFPIGLSVSSWKNDEATFYSGIIRDISEQKRAEAVLRNLTEASRRSDELKSALLASVSHDLRTPLTSIRTAIDNLLQGDLQWDHAQQQEFHLIISEEAARLTRLIGDLLDMARIEAGELRPSMQLGAVAEICGNVLERCERELRHHRVRVDCSEDLPLVKVDSPLIAEGLTHLVENAARYSPSGSEILVSARLARDELLISVKDHGPGIEADEFDRVFEKFYRSTRLKGDSTSGTGMGLAIARGIIEAHGGRIWVDSKVGHGAVFTFALPVGEDAVAEGLVRAGSFVSNF
jgi:PAS domain S-box-containing protein